MTKYLFLLALLALSLGGISQPVINRTTGANTVNDPRLMSTISFNTPRYADTTAANSSIGIDSCAALIFTYDVSSLWVRACSPKRWVKLLKVGEIASQDLQQTLTTGSTLTQNNTIAGGGFRLYFQNGRYSYDSTQFNPFAIPFGRVSQINLFGNSISQGQNSVPLDLAYYNLITDTLKAYLQNYALSGMGVFYSCQKHDSIVNGQNNNAATFVMTGYNDNRASSTSARTRVKIASGIKAMFLNHFANFYLPASTTPTDTSITRYGTWTTHQNAMQYSGKTKMAALTSTLNDSIVWISQPATTIGMNLIGGDSLTFNHSIVELFIDNVSQGEFNTNNVADGTALVGGPNTRISYSIIVGGLTNVSHRVKLVNKAARIMYVDYFTSLDNKKSSFVIFHNINPLGGTAGDQGAANARIDSMITTLPTGFPVVLIRTNNFFNPVTGLDVDGVHPNNTGHYQIYNAFRSAYDSAVSKTPGSIMFDGRNLWLVGGSTWQKILNPSDVWTKGDAAINTAGYIGVPAIGSYKQAGLDVLKTDHILFNTKVGALAGISSTTAAGITAVGYQALTSTTTGGANTAVGYRTMELTVTGTLNTAVGYFSQRNNTGDRNTSLGYNTLFTNASGADNTAVGASTLAANTGSLNTAVGSSALIVNTTGSQNNAFGYRTMIAVTTQSNNNAFGTNTLRDNTGSGNAGFGSQVMWLKGAGDNNAIFGSQAFQAVGGNTFSNNTAIGFQAGGIANTTGSNNIFVGYRAGDNLTSGGNNILLGYDIDLPTATTSSYMSIANTIFSTGPFATGTTISTANIGVATTGPDRKLDILDNAAAQLRLTHTDGTVYGEFQVNSSGNLFFTGSNTSPLFGLGGTTSAFPGLVRDGTSIQVRLADNSANTNLKVLDQAFDATTWNGNDEVPTKNAVRDKWESTFLTGSGTLDFPSTAAGTSSDLTITVTGAADGDVISIGVPNGSTLTNGFFTAWVSGPNTATIRFTNPETVGALDPASGVFKATVFKF